MSVVLLALTDHDRESAPLPALEHLCSKARAGSVGIVLRDRERPVRERIELGRALRRLCDETEQLFIVAERLDLALELGADGVHLPAAGVLPSEARRLFPRGWLSRAHHDVDGLSDDEVEACTALLVSPAFAPRKGRPALGELGLGQRCAALRRKAATPLLFALGGIDADRARSALDAGADGVAAIGSIFDPTQRAALLDSLRILRS